MTKRFVVYQKAGKWVTRIDLFSQEQYESGPFEFGSDYTDGTLNKMIASLEAIRADIPEEYRETARCGIEGTTSYDSAYAQITVNYERPATEDEIEHARKLEAARQDMQRNADYQAFLKLKSKFEQPTTPSSVIHATPQTDHGGQNG